MDGVDHVVVVESDEQGVVVQEQTKLREIKVNVLYVEHTTHAIHIWIIGPITVFQQEQILYEQGIGDSVVGLRGIVVAGVYRIAFAGFWPQILVQIHIHTAHGVHFGDGPVEKTVIVRLVRTPHG